MPLFSIQINLSTPVLVYKHVVPFLAIVLEAFTQTVPLAKKGGILLSFVIFALYQTFYIAYYMVSGTAIYPVPMFTPGTAGYAFGLCLNLLLIFTVAKLLGRLKEKQLEKTGINVEVDKFDVAMCMVPTGSGPGDASGDIQQHLL